MPIKLCSIGCGAFARMTHGPSIRKYASEHHDDLILSACCDLNEEAARQYQKDFGYRRWYTDCQQMLDVELPDAVCLVVSVSQTANLATDILHRGIPLMMEKPPGRNEEEVLKILAATQNGTKNQVALNRRYTPLIRALWDRLRKDAAPGQIQNIRYDFYRMERFDEDFSTTAIHGIDTVRFLSGSSYRSVRIEYQDLDCDGNLATNIYLFCKFSSGATAQISFCPACGVSLERAVVNSYQNTWLLNVPMWKEFDSPGELVHIKNGTVVEKIRGDELSSEEMFELSGFYAENAAFLDAVRLKQPIVNSVDTAVQSVILADCIRKRITHINFEE